MSMMPRLSEYLKRKTDKMDKLKILCKVQYISDTAVTYEVHALIGNNQMFKMMKNELQKGDPRIICEKLPDPMDAKISK
jgi:hypothetical protein